MRQHCFLIVLCVLLGLGSFSLAATKKKPSAKTPALPPTTKTVAVASTAPALDAVLLDQLKARSIGPAIMSGRVSDIAYDPKDPYTFYIALATGGVMKTTDNGATFKAIFEKEPVFSIGAVAVAPSDSKIVWVGTGEADDRNSAYWGDGVYLSTDAGATWKNVGLNESKGIARILVSPADPMTAYVAVVGDLWQPSAERGLYKTTDGGKTWKAVLQAAAPYQNRVGCGDVTMDPSNPDVVYAALYARQRTPWSFTSGPAVTDGKDVGGIFKSTDGGATWKKLEKGLPAGTGRIGLDIFRKDPKIVYAVIQSDFYGTSGIDDVMSKSGGIFRSEDGGESWTRMSGLDPRPFYFSQIRVDPENDKRVYDLGFMLNVSEDGGKTFREDRFKNVHPDCHALAIDPRSPARVILGTDGGAYQSFNHGEGWAHLNRFAAGEYYRISLDSSDPYRICGGLQDNMNWVGPNSTRTKDGILNSDWTSLGGGDGFYCVFDQKDFGIIYTESQQGTVYRFDLASGAQKRLRPEAPEGQKIFRFNWTSPLIGSHFSDALYLAGNHVFKLTDRGEHWKMLSPDLSMQNPDRIQTTGSGAETFGVVYALAESPVQAGVLWAGTDDGKLWITTDEGESWTDLTSNLPGEALGLWISRIEPSRVDAKTAYLAIQGYRTGNDAPLAYRTIDAGKTWQSIRSNLPDNGPVEVIREDPKNPKILYAGTEFGLFVSFNQGESWTKFGGLPTIPVHDIQIQPQKLDLVAATHGRSLYVLDDISVLEEMTPEIEKESAHLFPIRPSLGFDPLPGFSEWNGNEVYSGANAPLGAIINVWIKAYTGKPVSLAITNSGGQPVANLKAEGVPGLNRVVWNLKPTKDLLTEYGGQGEKFLKPGEYTVTLTYGDIKQVQKLNISIAEGIETR
ncbi:MAG: hypothetical protein PHX83_03765 [Acidobacteriia bacterium]|nr:hypothetical protein [Terriglobia bacterium]